MKTFPISCMIVEFEKVEGLTAIERAIDCFELPDGRRVQLTAKLETDESLMISMPDDVKSAIVARDARKNTAEEV